MSPGPPWPAWLASLNEAVELAVDFLALAEKLLVLGFKDADALDAVERGVQLQADQCDEHGSEEGGDQPPEESGWDAAVAVGVVGAHGREDSRIDTQSLTLLDLL